MRESGIEVLEEPSKGDENDFCTLDTRDPAESRLGRIELLCDSIIFEFFPYLLIGAMFVALTHFNGSSFADMIAVGYLIFVIYFVANFRTLFTKNLQLIQPLRQFNMLVLSLYLVFQAPAFPCPGIPKRLKHEKKYFYVPAAECFDLVTSRDHRTETWHTFYFVLAQSIGLQKFKRVPLGFLIIVLITEIQCWAFSHPYFKTYVLGSIRHEKLDGKMRGFMHVEKFHLARKWAYKSIRAQIAILHNRLMRITKEYNRLIDSY